MEHGLIKDFNSTNKDDRAHRPHEEEVQQMDKKKVNANEGPEKDEKEAKESESNCITDEETGEGSKENSDCDHDGDVFFHEDKNEEIDKGEIEEEVWIEYVKRSTKEAE